ncbi:MAG: hypothetical protein DRJ03_15910 [Chloroflexi bacterium]|nr:MAG: hypothetical protein DRJ03_15910 [Chloroflexota bacterium]
MDQRADLLNQTAQSLMQAAGAGLITREPIYVFSAQPIVGPRAGALSIHAGLGTGKLCRALSADKAALARQFISWHFTGHPSVYLDGPALRIEAPWPSELAQDSIRLAAVCKQPKGNGRWVLGVNERGQNIIGKLDDETPNWLLGGTTGSGKSVALHNMGLQLSWDVGARQVLIDGKMGAGLGVLANLPGTVGPVATDVITARDALGWVYAQLEERYRAIAAEGEQAAARFPHLVTLFDEFQEFTGDAAVLELLRRIVNRGRAARIHTILATQHPTIPDAFGDDSTIKRNLPGRVALKVLDAKASEVIIGGPVPRADRLAGRGDAYTIGGAINRVQLLLVDHRDLDQAERQPPPLETWPEFEPSAIGQEPTVQWAYTGEQLAYGLKAAHQNDGRPALQMALEKAGLGRPGSTRAARLLRLCREQLEVLEELGLGLKQVAAKPYMDSPGTHPGQIIDVDLLPRLAAIG